MKSCHVVINTFHKSYKLTNNPVPGWETFPQVVGQGNPSKLQSNIGYLCCLDCLPKVKGTSLLLKPPHRTYMIWAWYNLKVSFLWSSFHRTRNYCTSCRGREGIHSPMQLRCLWTTALIPMATCNSGTHLLMVTTYCLIGLKAPPAGGRWCLSLEI